MCRPTFVGADAAYSVRRLPCAAHMATVYWMWRCSTLTFGGQETQGHRKGRVDEIVGADSTSEAAVAFPRCAMYGECMARLISTTVRLDEEDVRALKRARAAGFSASELIRKGLRVVASRYYTGRRPPSTRLFESTDTKLGDESELFRDLED